MAHLYIQMIILFPLLCNYRSCTPIPHQLIAIEPVPIPTKKPNTMQSSVNPASTESIFMAQQSQLINKTLENLPNEAVMNILAGLNPVNLINWVANVLNHPKIKV
jgi:hypothetical protein